MIVDTSALIATLKHEDGHETLLKALTSTDGLLPAPAMVEFHRVASRSAGVDDQVAVALLDDLLSRRLTVLPFSAEHARVAAEANALYGIGNGRGGTLNLLDLMVYACARVERRPILCTGRDFAATDAAVHPASRGSWTRPAAAKPRCRTALRRRRPGSNGRSTA